jgi:hypothetical protein
MKNIRLAGISVVIRSEDLPWNVCKQRADSYSVECLQNFQGVTRSTENILHCTFQRCISCEMHKQRQFETLLSLGANYRIKRFLLQQLLAIPSLLLLLLLPLCLHPPKSYQVRLRNYCKLSYWLIFLFGSSVTKLL